MGSKLWPFTSLSGLIVSKKHWGLGGAHVGRRLGTGQSGWIEPSVRGGGSCHGQESVQGAPWTASEPCTWAEGCTQPGMTVCRCRTAGRAG